MHYTLEFLVEGRGEILHFYQEAVRHWAEIWQRPESKDVKAFASLLSGEQFWFERNCGTRWIGQEVMVVSGFAMIYSTQSGFRDENQARHLYAAFQMSTCSVEVKYAAERVAESYDLIDSSSP